MSTEIFNPNPTIFAPVKSSRTVPAYVRGHSLWLDDTDRNHEQEEDDLSDEVEKIDQTKFLNIRSISDPEHRSMTLEQLAVVSARRSASTPDSRQADSRIHAYSTTLRHEHIHWFVYPSQTSAESATAVQNRCACEAGLTSERACAEQAAQ
ncbi:hypothetical protein A0H81_04788 [Grifola frondosa]|uniref:Uncharacterized protein n=1 Tax=Grifola frondosa TaxID=5627 RepID=A0A1C7MFD9_GRIFR|nr:hypothetical protein A0H81_04788 [Grifola frondosa]